MRLLHAAVAAFVSLSALAQAPYLVTDLNATRPSSTASSGPEWYRELNGTILFGAATAASGRELWRFEGGTASIVRDIHPGQDSGSPLFPLGDGVAYFSALDSSGRELWKTDGTPDGTIKVADVNPSGNGNVIVRMAAIGKVFFTASDGTHGTEPWVSDGTAEGTRLLADLNGTSASSTVGSMFPLGDRVLMFANNAMWTSDGTPEGTTKLATAAPSVLGARRAGATVYFTTSSATYGRELWKTDGTDAGTQLVVDLTPGAGSTFATPVELTTLGSTVYFLRTNGTAVDVWKSDGTAEGTQLAVAGAGPAGSSLFAIGSHLWIYGNGGLAWSDGTEEGTVRLAAGPTEISVVTAAFGRYFVFRNAGPRLELWSTDGTVDAIEQVMEFPEGARLTGGAFFTGGRLYFTLHTNVIGAEPWVSEDGTAANTHLLANIAADPIPSSNPESFTAAGDQMFFTASTDTQVSAQWFRSDGTAAGTRPLTRFVNPYFGSFTGWNGALYFEHAGSDLYRTDGTTAGTRLLKQFAPSLLRQFYAGSRYLYFVAGADSALWRSDGTADGTVPLATGGGVQPRYVEGMTELGGRLYLFASGDLVVTDGSASSTRVITKWESDELPTTAPVAAGGMLFFGRNSSVHGIELWRSDGTLDGTVLVKDIAPGATPSGPAKLTGAGAYVFFVANDGTHGNELWRSDGTEAGTILLRDVRAGAEGSNIGEIAQVGAFVYFVADDGVHGAELWRSDGTPEGTVLVSDVRPGAQSSMWGSLAGVDGTLYFTADDGVHGAELWRTNAAGGVELVADLAPGGDASAPSQGVRAGRMLYFAASTALGREPWALPLAPSAVSIDDVRVTEGNAGTSIARFTVTRSGDTSASATIAFTTADGSATAGEDYVAASGVLAFAAGESVKTIDVTIHGDTTVELHEAFRVVLAPQAGMPATRDAAFGVIDNDDRRVDLEVQWTPSDAQTSRRTFRITNHGPSAASDVVFRYNESPYAFSVTIATAKSTCYDLAPPAVCAIEPIASGESIDVSVHITFAAGVDTQFPANHHRTIHASATAVETDTNAANDGAALTMSSDGRMVVPAFLTAGETGPGTLVLGTTVNETATVALEAESTSLIPNPSHVIIPPGASTGAFTVTAGPDPGVVRLQASVNGYPWAAVPVTIAAPGTTPKLDVAFAIEHAHVAYGNVADMHVVVAARRADGTLPTGTIAILENGNAVDEQPLVDGAATFRRIGLPPGSHAYTLRYDGDANFNALTGGTIIAQINEWRTSVTVDLPPLVCTSADVHVTVRNESAPASPAGSVELTVWNSSSGPRVLGTIALQPSGSTRSTAVVHYTAAAGDYSMRARYIPDGTFAESLGDVQFTSTTCMAMGLVATGAPSGVTLTWSAVPGAHHYDVIQWYDRTGRALVGTTAGTSFVDTTIGADAVHLYTIIARDASDGVIAYSHLEIATTMAFTDDPLIAGATTFKTIHLAQLRTLAYKFSSLFAGTEVTFTPIFPAIGTTVRAAHFEEIRSAIAAARQRVGLPPVTFTDTLAPGVPIRAIHVQELRNAFK